MVTYLTDQEKHLQIKTVESKDKGTTNSAKRY